MTISNEEEMRNFDVKEISNSSIVLDLAKKKKKRKKKVLQTYAL